MYQFIDITATGATGATGAILPSEALKIDGQYIEDLIPGYRTLYVSGRETLSPEIETFDIAKRDGTNIKNRRLPGRTITVGYQLIAGSNSDFRDAFNKLAGILTAGDHELIFADEPDKFFTGIVQDYGDIEPGKNAITSEISFLCPDPYKYSVEEYVISSEPTGATGETGSENSSSHGQWIEDGGYFAVNYNGQVPARPKLEAHFYESDDQNQYGDCGYVAFFDADGHILQFGNPAEPDFIDEFVKTIELQPSTTKTWIDPASVVLINKSFNNLTGWTTNSGGMTHDASTAKQMGSAEAAPLWTNCSKAAKASSYGSAELWHGPSITATLPSDGGDPATTGAKDWTFHATLRFAGKKDESGLFQTWIMTNDGGYLAGVSIYKARGGTKGKIRAYISDYNGQAFVGHKVYEWTNQDLSYYNARFGSKKKSTDPDRPLNVDITKTGKKFDFNLGGLKWTITDGNLASVIAKKVCLYFAKRDYDNPLSKLGVYNCKFASKSVNRKLVNPAQTKDEYDAVNKPNIFTTNDVLFVDCNEGMCYMQSSHQDDDVIGTKSPGLGALGNDWEDFYLNPGINQIGCVYSEWVNDAYKPTFKLKYREVFL